MIRVRFTIAILMFGSVLALSGPVLARTVQRTPLAASVVSLLAPAHGSAFAYGRPGQLVTMRSAVGHARRVRLVTAAGKFEIATVVATTDHAVVELRGSLRLSKLMFSSKRGLDSRVLVLAGPLERPAEITGRVLADGRMTITGTAGLDGAAILDARGRVPEIASATRGTALRALSLTGLRATPPAKVTAEPIALLPLILIFIAVGIGIGTTRLLLRARIDQRLELAERRWATRGVRISPVRSPDQQTADHPAEPDPDVDVVLRTRSAEEPLAEVRLRSRPDLTNYASPSDRAAVGTPTDDSTARRERPSDA